MAIRAAQEKASLLAREIGQSIGPAYSISEDSDQFAPRTSAAQNNVSIEFGDASNQGSATAPGSISVTARVTVRFRLL
ncbi:MAG TPA: SIMPL domain-containing protein [Pyrinomonadaceae bacterium]|nr:SIMPL domain-containing protein [Pyrinomonadaceae bacterium]